MTYLKIFFKIQANSTAHYILPWKVAAIVEEIPRGRCAAVAAAASGVVVVVAPGNKSKMDFLGAVWLVASSGGERKHLPVYSRLAVTRQPSSDRLVRHESCSAPSVIRPYVLNARVCTYVRVRVFTVCRCLRVHTTPRYQPVCRHQPTDELLLSPLRPPLSFRPLNLPIPSFLRPRLPPFLQPKLEKDEEGRRAGISSTKYGCTCLRIPIFYVEYGVSKDEDEGCLTFDRCVDDVDSAQLLKMSYTPSFLSSLQRVNDLGTAGILRKLMNF